MKALFIPLAMMCFGVVCTKAETTDVSVIDNVVYIDPVTASAGTQCVLSVQMKNTDAITGYEFFLELPEGLTFAQDEDDFYLTALSTARTTTKKTNYFDCTVDETGALHVLCSTTAADPVTGNLYTFSGNDGEVCTVTIDIPSAMPQGEYTLTMKDIVLTPSAADKGYETSLLKTTITIEAAGDTRTVLDETSIIVPSSTETEKELLVKRTLKANEWSTICLPFEMTESQLKEAFGAEVSIADFVSYDADYDDDDNVMAMTVNFEDVDISEGFEANHPYIIKASKDVSEFSVTAIVTPEEDDAIIEYDNGKTGKKRVIYGTFVGTYHAGDNIPANCLFISGNKFWYSTGKTKLKAFRGYFDFDDVLSSVSDVASVKFDFFLNGMATSIEELDNAHSDYDAIYTIAGQRVLKVRKGVYIKNGKKVVVR